MEFMFEIPLVLSINLSGFLQNKQILLSEVLKIARNY